MLLNEQALIIELLAGNRESFRKLVENYKHKVFNVALSVIQQRQDAEDISQEVFIEIFDSIAKFKCDCKLSTWIYRITVRKSLDHLRWKKRKKRFAVLQSLVGIENNEVVYSATDFVHPGVLLENQERSAILFKAIAKLPESQKTAFTLYNIECLSYKEICEVMQISLSSIESLMHRAKQNLRKYLAEYYKNS